MTSATLPGSIAPQRPRLRWLRIIIAIPLTLLTVIALLVGVVLAAATMNTPQFSFAPITAQTTAFDGQYLLAASDADMIGTAYADGILMQVAEDTDTLSLVELPLTDESANVIEIPVSNSVTSWPQIIAVAPDGNAVYVVETAGEVEDSIAQLPTSDFPPGRVVTRINLTNGAENPVITTADIGVSPIHLAISADGDYLAVGLREAGRQLAILPTATLDDPSTFSYFAINDSNGAPATEVTAVSWHPSGDFLAVGNDSRELQFYRVERDNDSVTLAPHGERLTLGNTITYGQFTTDGRFYLTAEINWAAAPSLLANLINPPGEMIAISFDTENAAHRVVSRVEVGLSPEGFAVNPDEDLIVTVNMGRTYLPDALASIIPAGFNNSLSLLSFDNETGELTVLEANYGFEGVLPEQAMFDRDGDSLGVVIYNERENPMNPGYIEFWNVLRDGEPARLERTDVRVPVVRGAHAMNLIP
jgi:DNA-binding beta-propeller fold protein YncE